MATKERPKDQAGHIPEGAFNWFRRFLVELNDCLLTEGEKLDDDSEPASYRRSAIRAVVLTLMESGADLEPLRAEFASVLFSAVATNGRPEWTDEMNQRRFDLIDREIQGLLSPVEQMELEALTQALRCHVESENLMPFSGAQALHRRLVGQAPASSDPAE